LEIFPAPLPELETVLALARLLVGAVGPVLEAATEAANIFRILNS
jgi:hypothetical protein